MELKDYKDCTVLCAKQSVPFVREFEKHGQRVQCEVVKVGLGVIRKGDDPINWVDYLPTSQNDFWTSFKAKDGTEFDICIGDSEIYGELASRSKNGLVAEIYPLDSEKHINTSVSVFAKEVLVA